MSALKALPILKENKHPNSIPISELEWNANFVINTQAAMKQGFDINLDNLANRLGTRISFI